MTTASSPRYCTAYASPTACGSWLATGIVIGRSCWSGAGCPPSSRPAKKARSFSIGHPRQIIAAASRKDGTIQSVRRSVKTLPICEASWPLIGAKVPIRPWRWSLTIRSSSRRPSSMARYICLKTSGAISGSRAASRFASLSRMDRCSIVNGGSRGFLGMLSAASRLYLTPAAQPVVVSRSGSTPPAAGCRKPRQAAQKGSGLLAHDVEPLSSEVGLERGDGDAEHGGARLPRVVADVRRDQHIGKRPEHVVRRRRLRFVDVERGAGDLPFPEQIGERDVVHDPGPRGVDEIRARLHAGQQRARDEPVGLRCVGEMNRHDVRPREKLFERDGKEPVSRTVARQATAPAEGPHADPGSEPGHLHPDRAESYDPQYLVPQLDPLKADRKSTRLNSSHSQISYAV